MKRTSPVTLVVWGAVSIAAGFVLDLILERSGHPTFTPSILLPLLAVLLGAAVLTLAWQVRRSVTRDDRLVDPFRAVRVVVLAKASSIVGAVVAGVAAGMLVYLLTRPVVPGLGSMAEVIASAIGGMILVILALIAEHLCTLPKDPDDREPHAPEHGAEPGF
ncbi:DUF3180 domain-containing protein [Microbacterium indicum]|uniref:DUF3180 domain-containing protein n=1 Tax=Microbacterium indicum TaxID=358100 RepID=UPI0003F8E718|nr:DUF3180 domain-containing protein [Microbacterium indicum]